MVTKKRSLFFYSKKQAKEFAADGLPSPLHNSSTLNFKTSLPWKGGNTET